MRHLFCAVMFLAAVPVAHSSELGRVSADPERGTTEVLMPDDVRVVYDYQTQRAYVAQGLSTFEFSFEELARREHPGDTAAQQAFVREINSHLSPSNEPYTLTTTNQPTIATDYSRFSATPPGPPPGGTEPDLQPLAPPPGIGGPCDLGPCTPTHGYNGRLFYVHDGHSISFDNGAVSGIGTKSVEEQRRWAADYDRFRGQVCGLGLETGGQVVAWGGAVVACGKFARSTGPGMGWAAGGCALGGLAGLISNGVKNRAERQCKSQYPGPGEW